MPAPFWSQTADSLLSLLQSSATGLTGSEAANRLSSNNRSIPIKARWKRDLALLVSQFKSPLVLLLVAGVILSAVLGETSDAFIILFILLATGFMGFFQERNAGRAVEKLQAIIQLKCNALRDGKIREVTTHDIVPGDVLVFAAGDIVPADCLLLEANELHANEASLTGESYPARKAPGVADAASPISKRTNCLWQGSNIISGSGKAVVVYTGKDTVFGQISQSTDQTVVTSFEKGIKRFGYFLMQITVILCIIILAINLYFHKPFADSILFALALAVGMAPELLPAIMTIAMSAGAKRMATKKVIVKKLSCILNFGEVNLLCTDKTGTITEGIIKVTAIKDITGNESAFAAKLAVLNASFESGFANPIDDALRQLQADIAGYEKTGEVPYDFIRKRLSVAVKNKEGQMLVSKGAVKNIMDICSRVIVNNEVVSIDAYKQKAEELFSTCSEEGNRVIAICYKPFDKSMLAKEDESDMIFAGFILLNDPLKAGITETLDRLKALHIKIKIITGDNPKVAQYVARQIGLENPVIMSGAAMQTMSPEAFNVQAARTDIFAETEPHQKERIIKALQKNNFTIAYIGDGINDVAAIHAADAGISTSNAVDVAKEAADFVMLEKDLGVLADGIIEGRKTFANTLKYIFINTGATFGNMFSVAGASLMLPFLPMLPKQILLTNFITDFPYLAVASDNVDDEQIREPGKWNLKILRNFMIVFGLHSSAFDFITFYTLFKYFKVPDSLFQTGWFTESIITELLILFIIRTRRSFIKSKPGKYLLWFSVLSLFITLALPFTPLGPELGLARLPLNVAVAIVMILALYVITADIIKIYFFRRQRT